MPTTVKIIGNFINQNTSEPVEPGNYTFDTLQEAQAFAYPLVLPVTSTSGSIEYTTL